MNTNRYEDHVWQGPTITRDHEKNVFLIEFPLSTAWAVDNRALLGGGTLGEKYVAMLHEKLNEFLTIYLAK